MREMLAIGVAGMKDECAGGINCLTGVQVSRCFFIEDTF